MEFYLRPFQPTVPSGRMYAIVATQRKVEVEMEQIVDLQPGNQNRERETPDAPGLSTLAQHEYTFGQHGNSLSDASQVVRAANNCH
jgi:hypothetical protein